MELVSLARDMAQSAAEQAASYRPGQSVLRQLDRALGVVEESARWAVPPPYMELVSLARDMAQSAAEQAASYRPGQSVLRQLDRALGVVEESARWAVPPPLDQDDRPQPELVRPLPWVFFLVILVALRVSRESISLLNLALGKPPVTSTDVVIFIQSKRRYLRTLKYQGSRVSRARGVAPARVHGPGALHRLLEMALCFRGQPACGNNNTTRLSNNDEVVVVKRSKRGRQETSPVTSAGDNMERLIEKMLADLDAESEDDSFTVTNASAKSDRSDLTAESDNETTLRNNTPTKLNGDSTLNGEDLHFSPSNNVTSSTPEKDPHNHVDTMKSAAESPRKEVKRELEENNISGIQHSGRSQVDRFRAHLSCDSPNSSDYTSCEDAPPTPTPKLTTKQISEDFIAGEKEKTPKRDSKIGNGRTAKSTNKKKGPHRSEVPPARVLTSNNSF